MVYIYQIYLPRPRWRFFLYMHHWEKSFRLTVINSLIQIYWTIGTNETKIRTNNDFLWSFPIIWNTISCDSFRFWLCFEDAYERKKLQALNKLSKWYVGISNSVLLWFKEGRGPQFGRVINGLRASISHPVV